MDLSAWLGLLLISAGLLGGCQSKGGQSGEGQGERGGERRLVIIAASSLRDVFKALDREFRLQNPEAKTAFNFAGTQQLRRQLEEGARADLFAAADPLQIEALATAGLLRGAVDFAQNELIVALSAAPGEPEVASLEELLKVHRLVIGVPEVPVGRYTLQLLANFEEEFGEAYRRDLEERILSREFNVRQVLMKVLLAEAQAGFVYRSDLLGVGGLGSGGLGAGEQVKALEIPAHLNVRARYQAAVTAQSSEPDLAERWLQVLASPKGQEVLREAGFLPVGAVVSDVYDALPSGAP